MCFLICLRQILLAAWFVQNKQTTEPSQILTIPQYILLFMTLHKSCLNDWSWMGGERMVGGGDVQIQPHRPLCLACTSWNMVWHSSMYSSYKLSRRVAAAICSWRAGTSNATAQLIVQAQCWKGTQVFPRYGFLKVITLYPKKKENVD